jgi:SNF2 family DNA or RNA helicase
MQAMLDGGYAKRFLVLAPKRVCTDVWPVEQKLWAHQMSLSVCVGSIKQRLASLNSSAQVVVTNYDNLQWLAKQTLDFDAVVFDELTRLKNPSGARFKALHKVLDCPIRWGLTGSFTSNGLEDVFGQCKIVDQSLLGRSKGAFQQQYFVLINKEYGEWAPRVGSLEKVMAVIKPATFVLEAGDYTLPSLNIVPVMCAMDLTHYNKMKKDFVVEFPTAKAVALNAGVVTGKLQQMASGFVYDANSSIWFSSHKFDRLDELLAENQRANTIIAYTYQEELAELKRRYPKAQTLDDTKAIERWNAGKIEMLLVHPKSAGHGLNLQHGGCNMVFLSLPWSLELYEQTIGRLHRSGQKNAVWVYVMTTLKTVDERIYAALQDKRAISDIAMEELK